MLPTVFRHGPAARRCAGPFRAAAAVDLAAISLALFSVATWNGIFAIAPQAREALDFNLVDAEKMQSLYAAVRVLGGSVELAYAFQIALTACVLLALVLLLRRRIPTDAHGSAMAAATLLSRRSCSIMI